MLPNMPVSAASSLMTPEQRIQQLDKLAAGGFITPAEYKAKKKAILDSL
ncbi:MAG: SHOCT domain-containing protein [Thiogranum sp.]